MSHHSLYEILLQVIAICQTLSIYQDQPMRWHLVGKYVIFDAYSWQVLLYEVSRWHGTHSMDRKLWPGCWEAILEPLKLWADALQDSTHSHALQSPYLSCYWLLPVPFNCLYATTPFLVLCILQCLHSGTALFPLRVLLCQGAPQLLLIALFLNV